MQLKSTFRQFLCFAMVLGFGTQLLAQISVPNASFTNAQDFNTLALAGTSSTVPTGWAFFETGANQNALYTAATGSGNAGDTYSFGLAANTERAFGGLQSGSLIPTVGVCYTNNTAGVITSLDISYTGETWRVGTANRTDGIQFQYNQNTTAINGAGTWTSFPALDYFNPGQAAVGSGSVQHSATISSPITGLSIAPGATFCFRWNDFNATGSDDGIGIDDYSLTNIVAPSPCDVITPLACGTAVAQSLTGTGLWNTSFCGNSTVGSEAVYSFTPTMSGVHTLIINGVGGDPVDFGYKLASGGCSSTGWNCIGTSTGTSFITFGPLTAGVQYYILLDAHTTVFSAQNFEINCNPVPANDLCVNAITIPGVNANICGTTLGANPDVPNAGATCGTSADAFGSGVWYTFVGTGQTWDFFFPQIAEDWDPEVNVYSGSCGALTCVTGDDDSGGGLNAQFSVNSVAGTTYYVYVHPADDFGNGTSDFCLDLTLSGTPPVVLTCPTNRVELACLSQDTINSRFNQWLATASGTGGCNGVLTNNNTGAPSACGGSTTVTFTYTSTCAPLTTTCQATFTVPAAPTVLLTCPTNTTAAACQTQAAVNAAFATWLATASASGGCNGVLTNNNTGAPAACGGSTTVTFTYTSTCAPLTTTCQATFTVPAAPTVVLTCPTNTTAAACQTQAAVNTAFATWLATATASGGCNGALTNNNSGAPAACGGSTTVTFTYTSTCAPLTTTCQATFTVAAAPTVILTCPTNTTAAACQTQAAVNTAFATWLATASASGGCNGVLTNNNTGAPAACGGATTVTFTYTSTCAPLTTTCQATFTVASSAVPVLNCPIPTTASACLTQAQLNTAYANWLASASVTGGCSGGTLTNDAPAAPLICNPNSNTITVTFTYAGATCQTAAVTCTSTFTVPAYPAFNVPANGATTVSCPALIVQPVPPVVVDGCGNTLTPTGPAIVNAPNPITCEGTRTFTWTYTDCAGLVRTWSHVTTVERNPFTVPANGAATVACPALATQPVPPVVLSDCGETLTPTGPVVTNVPNPLVCEGTRTYAWTYTDCEGNTATWSFVYTIERLPFTVPANGGSTVACPDQTDAQPVPPVVTSNCGEVLTPVITVGPKPGCEGQRLYTFRYTDCEGNTADWLFIYNVEYLDFTVPASQTVSVECPVNAVQPTPPTVVDNCGKLLFPSGPVITNTNATSGCLSSRSYAWTYSDCEGNAHVWSKTYNFLYSADFAAPVDEVLYVSCLGYAVAPFPQPLYDFCGQLIKVTGPSVTQTIASNGCSGTRKFSFVYTDCGGHSHPWSLTYIINDDQAPVGTCPGTGGATGPVSVDVTNLKCIEEVPCPDDYDFDNKIEELLEAGNYFDVCYGDELFVTLDSYTDLWECADPDGDGNFTFGRTFYFHIADRCGNAYPSLCEVTYSGACQPLNTFPQQAWGVSGGTPGTAVSATTTDLQVITTLLNSGPVKVGGNNRSITINDAQCVVNMLPGTGGPGVLANCQQTNCTGCNPMGISGMKNVLAANAIALELNLRYNVQYNGLNRNNINNQGLGCIYLHPCISNCSPDGTCDVHFFDGTGVEHSEPFTIGGLQNLVNLYLNGNLNMSIGQKVIYGTALNESLLSLNSYYGNTTTENACDGLVADNSEVDKLISEYGLDFNGKPQPEKPVYEISPNPTSGEVNFKLQSIAEGQEVSIEVINSLGQVVLRKDFGQTTYINERLDLSGFGSGLYLVSIKAGEARYEQKLVVGKN